MLFSNESNFILFIPRSILSASGTTVLFFKTATNLCQNELALLMPVFILRVPFIFSVFAFWIWLGISLSCSLPFPILTPKDWGTLAYFGCFEFLQLRCYHHRWKMAWWFLSGRFNPHKTEIMMTNKELFRNAVRSSCFSSTKRTVRPFCQLILFLSGDKW